MNIHAFIPFISGLLNLGLGLYVFLKGKDKPLNRVYLLFSLAVFFYCFNHFGLAYCRPEAYAVLWTKIFNTGAFFVVPTLLHLFLISANAQARWWNKIILVLSYLAGLAFLMNWNEEYVQVMFEYSWGFSPSVKNLPHLVMFINSIIVLPYGLVLLACKLRKTAASYEHSQLKYVMAAYVVGALGIMLNFIPQAGMRFYHLGPVFLALTLLTVAYAMLQYRYLDIDIIVNKTVLAILFSIPLLVLHSIIISLLFSRVTYIVASIISAMVVILILVFTPYKQLIEHLVDRTVYRGRFDYQKVLQELTQTLVAMLDLEQLLGYIVQIIVQTLEVEQVVLFLEDEEKTTYVIKAYYGIDSNISDQFALLETRGIVPWLRKRGLIFVKEEVKQLVMKGEFQEIYGDLNNINAEVVAPMFLKDRLVGVLTLGQKKNRRIFNQGDLDVLNALAAEAAVAIENARLYAEAIVDGLTRLYHHNYFEMRLKEEIARSKRYGHPVSMLMMDIDHFKSFNDTYGHPAGDLLLKEISKILREKIRETDLPARYGGEEFAIILPETGRGGSSVNPAEKIRMHIEDSRLVAERLREAVANLKVVYEGYNLGVTISVGVAFFDGVDENYTSEDLIKKADTALYQAKDAGRNKVVMG